jgi:hypothetical protein
MIDRLGRRSRIVLVIALAVVLTATVFAALDVLWLSIGVLGLFQVATVGLLLLEGPLADSSKRLDTLSTRLMAAVETERLDALDRHREILDVLGNRSDTDR